MQNIIIIIHCGATIDCKEMLHSPIVKSNCYLEATYYFAYSNLGCVTEHYMYFIWHSNIIYIWISEVVACSNSCIELKAFDILLESAVWSVQIELKHWLPRACIAQVRNKIASDHCHSKQLANEIIYGLIVLQSRELEVPYVVLMETTTYALW